MGEGTGMDGRAAGKTQGHPGLDEGQEGWGMLERARGGCGAGGGDALSSGTLWKIIPQRCSPPHLNGLLIKSFIRNP